MCFLNQKTTRFSGKEGSEMSRPKQKKFLIALDGSDRALDAVRYVSRLKPFQKSHVVLFNVSMGVPESYWDLEKNPQFSQPAREVRAWEMEQRKVMNEYMAGAKDILTRSGFSEESVNIKTHKRKKGVARDILHEAENGYNALIIGRKGFGTYKEIIIGSVANKLVDRASFLPVLMIGQIPPDENILIAFDASKGAMRAIDFVGKTLGGFNYKIHLLHVIRGVEDAGIGPSHLFLPKESHEEAEEKIKTALADAEHRLIDAGISPDMIASKIVKGAQSRAGVIIEEARKKDYGTIVIGRRGHSKVRDFFMGRVSNKIIQTIRNRTVWVIT
jgi:nucleotide-binding universal stress UspA family protein